LLNFQHIFKGQKLEQSQINALENLDPNAPLHERILIKYRRFIGILIPLTFYHTIWSKCYKTLHVCNLQMFIIS